MSPITIGFADCTPLLEDPAALRDHAEREGILFFKNLLPRDIVLELRRQVLSILDGHGWVDRSHSLMEGYANREAIDRLTREEITFCGVGVPAHVYGEVYRLPLFHLLPHHPAFLRVFTTLFGTTPLPHPRHIARMMMPSAHTSPTPAHQDYIHIQGTRRVYTSWVPLGDCPRAMGNLSLLPASHHEGIIPPRVAEGAGNMEVQLCGDDHHWVETDYEAGDVVIFHSLLVHKSIPSRMPDRIRLSCDFRFQPANEDIEERSLRTHCDVLEWDDVYAGWEGLDDLRYYWRRHDLRLSPWDDSIRWQKERICS